MAQKLTALRVVLASPNDVRRERESYASVLEQVNRDTARPSGLHLELWRWETDAYPGFHPDGPQGLIDTEMRVSDCDLFVGIFWNRIGTPTRSGKTGTEHEFGLAYRAWKKQKCPEIMLYFNDKPSSLTSRDELAQRNRVLAFRSSIPLEGLWWRYNGRAEFVKYANDHLRRFVHRQIEVVNAGGREKQRKQGGGGQISTNVFTLEIGQKGNVKLPPQLLKDLNMAAGDQLQIRVTDRRIESATVLSKDRPFDAMTISLLNDRLSANSITMTPSELRKSRRGKRDG